MLSGGVNEEPDGKSAARDSESGLVWINGFSPPNRCDRGVVRAVLFLTLLADGIGRLCSKEKRGQRGSHLIRTGDQYVIFCHKGDLRVILLIPTGPKGQKRPADVVSNAVHVMKVLTGEADDGAVDDGKDPAAKALGAKGGAARAKAASTFRRH